MKTSIYPLSKDKVASIQVLGNANLGEKSLNLFKKARVQLACDRERGIAWGAMRELRFV